jgi:chromosome segregation ATPase
MSLHTGPAAVGGLVVRNGKHRGARVPLKLPVTVIGRGDGCDVRLNAEGIAPLHCVIAVTPAGPTVRAWPSENTLVNGRPTAAAVLKHGDELKVGPCSFRVSWYGDLAAAEPDEPVVETGATAEWSLKEHEAALHEQEVQLAALLEAKQQQVHELLGQLADGREKFHAERDAIKGDLAAAAQAKRDAVEMKRAAELARVQSHATYRKLLARAKRQRAEGMKDLVAAKKEFERAAGSFAKEKAAFEAERAAFRADAEKTKSRLQDGWQMLEEGQRRLLADRTAAEAIFAEYRKSLDTRYAGIEARETAAADAQARMEARCADLLAEIAGLEQRAANANLAVQELEQRRVILEADGVPLTPTKALATVVKADLVPLDGRRDRSFDELMAELNLRERDLERDQKAVAAAKAEFARLSGELTDQRAVLAEQFAKVATAARLWQQSELSAAGELEELAARVDAREQSVAVRENRLLAAEDGCRTRERELWQFRVKLEGWQAGLTAHEAQWYATRDRAAAEADRQREHLAKWEASLETLCTTWNELRAKERDGLLAELDGWAKDRKAYHAAHDRLDDDRVRLAKDAKACAALQMAVEEAAAPADPKRLRVLRNKWESHFTRFERLWESRQKAATSLAATLDGKIIDLRTKMSTLATDRAAFEKGKQTAESKALAAERTAREKDAIVSLTVARSKRTDRELAELRGEVERVAASLLAAGQPTGEESSVALMPARAA